MKKKFLSLRWKVVALFAILLVALVLVCTLVMPRIFNWYIRSAKQQEMVQMKTSVIKILGERDFQTNALTRDKLAAVAESNGVTLWICTSKQTEDKTTVPDSVFSFGDSKQMMSSFGGQGIAQLTQEEVALILSVITGESSGYYDNAFASAFKGKMYSCGFSVQLYPSGLPNPIGIKERVSYPAAVFIHVPVEDITAPTRMMALFSGLIIVLVLAASLFMVAYLSGQIIDPVKQLQLAAEEITEGKYDQNVSIEHQDEIGRLTESFNEMANKLKEADALQSDFIANISHDFRSPLTSVKGYVEAMMDGTIPEDQFPKYMGIVLDETNRLTKMANNVLDLTKMENNQIELKPAPFDINEAVIKLALGFEQRVEEKRIQMEFRFLEEKLPVIADYELIQRVIYNLLDNALKFTSDEGTISVETTVVGKKALISVSDNGCGISEESLPHVFERFHKGDKSRGKDKKGAGLGLAIAHQIIVAHHETITVTSTEGEGTTFSFTLPLAK